MAKPLPKEVRMLKLGIYLPEEVHKTLRITAIEEGRSATALVRELIEGYLTKRGKKGGK
jgi:plasmid stability protein